MSILTTAVKFFCLLTPFFVLSLFLDVCKNRTKKEKHQIAFKTSLYIFGICALLLFFGNKLFSILGITLLAFQIGSGIVLLVSGMAMLKSNSVEQRTVDPDEEPSLIPLTLPVTVGPGTIGALFVLGNTESSEKICNLTGLFSAVVCIFLLLYFADLFEKLLKKKGLAILSKLTGLFLVILATQSILNGLSKFLKLN